MKGIDSVGSILSSCRKCRNVKEQVLSVCRKCKKLSKCRTYRQPEVSDPAFGLFDCIIMNVKYAARRIYLCDKCAKGVVK